MHVIKKIWLITFLCMSDQMLKSAAQVNPQDGIAEALIAQSFITPEMQYFIWKACNPQDNNNNSIGFTINVLTGKIPIINTQNQTIINTQIVENPTVDNAIKKEALHAMLEAIRIAKFKAALDSAYNQPTYLFFAPHLSSTYLIPTIDQNILNALKEKETNIKYALNNIRSNNGFWSWIPQGIQDLFFINQRQNPAAQPTAVAVNHFDNNMIDNANNYKQIPDSIMLSILKNYNYKQKTNPQIAAHLLFQQCFLAQQNNPIRYLTRLQNNPHYNITATSYIYDWFFNFDGICRQVMQNHITPQQAHEDFIAIRKAVQTALFIANKNSVFYLGYILPTAITQYLDNIVGQLMVYDAKVSLLCKDPHYGATVNDQYYDILLTRISYAAAGIAVTATIATDYQYGLGTSASWLFNGLFNTGKKALGYTATPDNNQKKEDAFLQNLTPQEKFKRAQEQLSKAQQAESKIYEDAIAQQKKALQTAVIEKESQEKKLQEVDQNLQKIIHQQPATLIKFKPQDTKSADTFIIDQQKVRAAQTTSENKLKALKKEAFASPKTQAALERKIKETELELANYENLLYTTNEQQKLKASLQKTQLVVNQENNKLIKAQQEYSSKKGWFGRWNGSEIDLKNLSEKEQSEYLNALNEGFINPLKEIINSDENKKSFLIPEFIQQPFRSKDNIFKDEGDLETTNNYYQQFQQALDAGTQRVNNYIANKQNSNNEYYAGLKPEEKKSDALWNALATSDYSIDPNSKTYEKNEKNSRNFSTGLTAQENSQFAPYAAGALAIGATPLAGAAITGSISSIATVAKEGVAQGFKNYAKTVAVGEKIATQAPKIIPAAKTGSITGKQIATGLGLTGAGIIGTGLVAEQHLTSPSDQN